MRPRGDAAQNKGSYGGTPMIGSTGAASSEPTEVEVTPLSAAAQSPAEPVSTRPRDLYAESELALRHERTERMIKRAQEQV